MEERALLEISTKVRLSDAVELVAEMAGSRPGLTAFLSLARVRLEDAAKAVEQTYFDHVKARRLVPEKVG